MYVLYSILFSIGVILAAPYYACRRGGVSSIAAWRERFGHLSAAFSKTHDGSIWVHAVSVGETLAVAGLIRELAELFPERKIYMSHVTPAGREASLARLPELAGRFYLPLDWRWSVRRVLRRLQPALLLIVETELWPNLLRAAHELGTRVILVNARLSDRSFRGYRMVRPFMRRILENVDRICAQTVKDAERFRLLGASPERVVVTGNLKFDALPQAATGTNLKKALRATGRTPLIVAASTMANEEPLLLQAWRAIRSRHSGALLILAPRHPARFEAVAGLLSRDGKSFVRRTGLPSEETAVVHALGSAEILLLDTIGELSRVFEFADLVFMGGSLVPTGGHNLLEPAFWGKPILFGPHMQNFAEIARLFLETGAAVQVRDAEELGRRMLELLDDDSRRRELGERAKQTLERESGATERVLEHVRDALGHSASLHARL